MREPEPYRLSDKTQEHLTGTILKRIRQFKKKLLVMGFDELNVIRQVEVLYENLDEDNRKAFKDLYADRFDEMLVFLIPGLVWDEKESGSGEGASQKKRESNTGATPRPKRGESRADSALKRILDNPSPVTQYAYTPEVSRKRERATEAILASPTTVQKQAATDKHGKYWAIQTGFYADIISDEAALDAMKDAGIKRVRWNAQNDGRVCTECKDRDGIIYPISQIPDKHPRCRCWLTPVR